MSVMAAPCDAPSHSRYGRGCRCDGCIAAQSIYKRELRRKKAEAEGRVHGEKPCAKCGTPISTLNGSNRKTYCEGCAALVVKEQRAEYRKRRDAEDPEKHVSYMREYYRANKTRLLFRHHEYYEATKADRLAQYRRYRQLNGDRLRARKRSRYPKKNTPTVHERALEAFDFRSSEPGGRGRGFRLRKCKCGCGMYVNAAHVAVVRLTNMGYTRQEIAARLGTHTTEVSQLRLDGEAHSWPWYRRGHGNLRGLQQQPVKARRKMSKDVELRVLIEQQDTDSFFGARPKSITGKSLDAVIGGTEGLALVDTIAATSETGDYSDTEESLFDWLHRNGIDLSELADRCAADAELASEMAESTELGRPTRRAMELIAA